MRILLLNALEKFGAGFVIGVLGNELAADREVEDSPAELLYMFGAGGEAREMVEVETCVLAEDVGRVSTGGVVQSMQGYCGQLIPPALPLRLRRLQPVTQRHQFIHLDDDAVLFEIGRASCRERV